MNANTAKVNTEYWAKPIPLRQFDWIASYDDDEPDDDGNMARGYGRTEQEAIVDLLCSHPRDESEPCGHCGAVTAEDVALKCPGARAHLEPGQPCHGEAP